MWQWLGALIDDDEQTNSALVVHRSTLRLRLQRIREISGHDLADPETCFNL